MNRVLSAGHALKRRLGGGFPRAAAEAGISGLRVGVIEHKKKPQTLICAVLGQNLLCQVFYLSFMLLRK